jgi:hypothetical protein
MAGMIQILTYLLCVYLALKGVEILQIALCSSRETKGFPMAIGVVALAIAIGSGLTFASWQDQQAQTLSRSVPSFGR